MTDHVHEWVRSFYGDWICKVEGCPEALSYTQVRNRLNAAERLSAVSARQAANWVTPKWIGVYNELIAYADTLEGK